MAILYLLALASGIALPSARLDIARRVAGDGRAQCTSYHADGSSGPCLPVIVVQRGGAVNGWSEGEEIVFSRAATERLTADEFALLAGHEIAHWQLRHARSTPRDELAADRLGAELACRAGFDPALGASLMRFYHDGSGHPPVSQRRTAVLAVPCVRSGRTVLAVVQ